MEGGPFLFPKGGYAPPLYPPTGESTPPYPLLQGGASVSAAASVGPKRCPLGTRTPLAPPRKGPLSSGLPQKGFQRGMKSRLPARSAMDGRHWRPSPPFEMRCIELSSPPVAARLPLLENEINGRGQGVGSLPCVVFSKGDSPPLKNSQPGPCRVNRTKCNLTRSH